MGVPGSSPHASLSTIRNSHDQGITSTHAVCVVPNQATVKRSRSGSDYPNNPAANLEGRAAHLDGGRGVCEASVLVAAEHRSSLGISASANDANSRGMGAAVQLSVLVGQTDTHMPRLWVISGLPGQILSHQRHKYPFLPLGAKPQIAFC